VLHPYLGIGWFKKLTDTTLADKAPSHIVFEHAYNGYARKAQRAEQLTATSSPTDAIAEAEYDPMDFLDRVALKDKEAPLLSATESLLNTVSETARFYNICTTHEGGKKWKSEPLLWWKMHGPSFVVIKDMARDFLAIPGTSASVERLFSKSRHVCTDLRSSL
jgi:hypothetical protein